MLDYPLETSPLARAQRDRPHLAQRFEFYVAGMELANAYGELADPHEQLRRFEAQQNDEDAMPQDQLYVEALHYGLPPTAGYGIGIDRLLYILLQEQCNLKSIKDVILFPL